MARKQGTGSLRVPGRDQLTRRKQDLRKQRVAIIVGVAAVLLITAIPAYGYWTNFIHPPRTTILSVNEVSYSLGYYAKLLKIYCSGPRGLTEGAQCNLGVAPFQLMNIIEESELIRQAAPRLNLSVAEEEISKEVRSRILPVPGAGEQPSPEELDREFKERHRQYLSTLNISQEEYSDIVRRDLLREKLKEQLGVEVPRESKQAYVHMINIDSISSNPQDASSSQDVSKRVQDLEKFLKEGADFGDLAQTFATNQSVANKRGVVGWIPPGIFPSLDEVFFSNVELGKVQGPIETPESVFFVKVTDSAEHMELSEANRDILKERAVEEWLAHERSANTITRCFGQRSPDSPVRPCNWQYNWVVKQLDLERKGPVRSN